MSEAASNVMDWIGRTEDTVDYTTPSGVARMSATLDRDDPPPRNGDPLPPGWHWIYFNATPLARNIRPDGHPLLGDFWPPVGLPRRMFAGARMTFHKPLKLGEEVNRRAEITSITEKEGRNGRLAFVGLRVAFEGSEGIAITEEQDIVYRPEPGPNDQPPPPQSPPENPTFSRVLTPDPVLLFRFSAMTFNGHRIHYDHPYVTGVEKYAGLVVHGPLMAILMVDLLRREIPDLDHRLESFSYRGMRPVTATGDITIAALQDGNTISTWVTDIEGYIGMKGEATLKG